MLNACFRVCYGASPPEKPCKGCQNPLSVCDLPWCWPSLPRFGTFLPFCCLSLHRLATPVCISRKQHFARPQRPDRPRPQILCKPLAVASCSPKSASSRSLRLVWGLFPPGDPSVESLSPIGSAACSIGRQLGVLKAHHDVHGPRSMCRITGKGTPPRGCCVRVPELQRGTSRPTSLCLRPGLTRCLQEAGSVLPGPSDGRPPVYKSPRRNRLRHVCGSAAVPTLQSDTAVAPSTTADPRTWPNLHLLLHEP